MDSLFEETVMAGRVLAFPKTSAFEPAIEIGGRCGISSSFATNPLRLSEMDMGSRAEAEGLGCIRGTLIALAFEAATGLVVYGAWRLIHFLL